MLISKTVEVSLKGLRNIKYYEDLGYKIPRRIGSKGKLVIDVSKSISVKVEHLPSGSNAEIEIQCDYCGKVVKRLYSDYYKRKIKEDSTPNKKDCCYECRSLKKAESDMLIYGVSHTTQLESTQLKMRKTMKKKYGVEFASQSEEIVEKMKQTTLEHYGVDVSSRSPIVKEKFRNTCLERYGVDHPAKTDEIKEKIHKTMYENGTAPCSNQQRYINNIINGELNYPVGYYSLDIAFPNELIYLEYDGSGHKMQVLYGRISEEEFNKREIKRHAHLRYYGWKSIKIISSKDYLPLDGALINIVKMSNEYFISGHTWIEFNIDKGTIRCSQFEKEYDFGNLRKINESDLKGA